MYKKYKQTYLQNRNRLIDLEMNLWLPGGKGMGEGFTGVLD